MPKKKVTLRFTVEKLDDEKYLVGGLFGDRKNKRFTEDSRNEAINTVQEEMDGKLAELD